MLIMFTQEPTKEEKKGPSMKGKKFICNLCVILEM